MEYRESPPMDDAWQREFAELHRSVIVIHRRLIGVGILDINEVADLGAFMGMASRITSEQSDKEGEEASQ